MPRKRTKEAIIGKSKDRRNVTSALAYIFNSITNFAFCTSASMSKFTMHMCLHLAIFEATYVQRADNIYEKYKLVLLSKSIYIQYPQLQIYNCFPTINSSVYMFSFVETPCKFIIPKLFHLRIFISANDHDNEDPSLCLVGSKAFCHNKFTRCFHNIMLLSCVCLSS